MSIEEIELDNVRRHERVLVDKHGELSNNLVSSINKIKLKLESYEIDEVLLSRISDVMYEVSGLDDVKEVESKVKHLADTFWEQV